MLHSNRCKTIDRTDSFGRYLWLYKPSQGHLWRQVDARTTLQELLKFNFVIIDATDIISFLFILAANALVSFISSGSS